MSKENKTVELKDEDLEQVSGGSKVGDAKFDNVTNILIDCVNILYNYIFNDSVYLNVVAAKDAQFNTSRYTAIKQALKDLDYYKDMYIRKSSESVYNDVVSKLKNCLTDSEN